MFNFFKTRLVITPVVLRTTVKHKMKKVVSCFLTSIFGCDWPQIWGQIGSPKLSLRQRWLPTITAAEWWEQLESWLSPTQGQTSKNSLFFYWSGTSWHITQRNLNQVNVSTHNPPFYVSAGSVSGIGRLMEAISLIPGPHRQGDLMTSGGINSTQLTLSTITERVENMGAITTTHGVVFSLIKSCAPFIFIVF